MDAATHTVNGVASDEGVAALSAREAEMLTLAADGYTAAEIARQLLVSVSVVRRQFTRIYDKLGVADKTSAVATAIRRGLIS